LSVLDGLIAAGVFAAVYLVMWFSYLVFLIRLARHHGPQAMRDAAEAVKVSCVSPCAGTRISSGTLAASPRTAAVPISSVGSPG
jgi:hypothetical protein